MSKPLPRIESHARSRRPVWRAHEIESARRTGGADTPRPKKADGTSFKGKFLRECKHTIKDSIGVKRAWLEKLFREAAQRGMNPLLVLGFSETRAPGMDTQWAVVPLGLFARLVEGEPA